MIIVGITGTIGAGKGTIVEYLINQKNFVHYSVRNFLINELNNRKMPINRDSMSVLANELRAAHTSSYIIGILYEQAKQSGKNAIIESIRTVGEIEFLQKKDNFYLLAVDAPPKTRYERIVKRNSETDHVSFEEFLLSEQREMTSDNPNNQNLSKCIMLSDYVLENNSAVNELYKQLEKILSTIAL